MGTTLLAAVYKHLLHTVKAVGRQAAMHDLKLAFHQQKQQQQQQHPVNSTTLDERAHTHWMQLTSQQQDEHSAVAVFKNPPVKKLHGGRVVYDACMRMKIPKAG